MSKDIAIIVAAALAAGLLLSWALKGSFDKNNRINELETSITQGRQAMAAAEAERDVLKYEYLSLLASRQEGKKKQSAIVPPATETDMVQRLDALGYHGAYAVPGRSK